MGAYIGVVMSTHLKFSSGISVLETFYQKLQFMFEKWNVWHEEFREKVEAAIVSRDDGVWLFPLDKKFYPKSAKSGTNYSYTVRAS